ncbi:hypothetical protein ABZX78_12150 [Streptomyces cellulosae]
MPSASKPAPGGGPEAAIGNFEGATPAALDNEREALAIAKTSPALVRASYGVTVEIMRLLP